MKQFYTLLLLFITSICFSQEAYYSNGVNNVDFNLTGIPLKNALTIKISNNTTFIPYTSGAFDTWDALKQTDVNPTNSSEVLLIYGWENGTDGSVTNDRERDINMTGGNVGDWNREHVYPRSLATPSLTTGNPGPGTDFHNLRPSDVQWNGARGSLRFATGSGNSGTVSDGWYPGDEWIGDVARMMMYMYLRYDGNGSSVAETQCLPSDVGVGSSAGTPDEMIDLFIQWNVDDPVSDVEMQRNSVSETRQGNRNPFIDNPALATVIWGGADAEDIWGNLLSTNTFATITYKMFPNPVKDNFVYFTSTQDIDVIIYDVLGKQVLIENITPTKDFINVSILNKGIYLVKMFSNNQVVTKKLIRQ
ncbi:endonuclease [bacterium AH-315-P13]|nr:endonuclease [bacterium AH-315-P13]